MLPTPCRILFSPRTFKSVTRWKNSFLRVYERQLYFSPHTLTFRIEPTQTHPCIISFYLLAILWSLVTAITNPRPPTLTATVRIIIQRHFPSRKTKTASVCRVFYAGLVSYHELFLYFVALQTILRVWWKKDFPHSFPETFLSLSLWRVHWVDAQSLTE